MAYTRAGVSPDGSSSFFLPRLVGHVKAMQLILMNDLLTAEQAQEWGLVNEVVADDKLMESVDDDKLRRRGKKRLAKAMELTPPVARFDQLPALPSKACLPQ